MTYTTNPDPNSGPGGERRNGMWVIAMVLGVAALSAGFLPDDRKDPIEVQGSCLELYSGEICTWAEISGDQLVSVGATVPLTTVENAPHEMEMVWPPQPALVLELPEQAKKLSGLDHMMVNWEHHGHPPTPFMAPHFDFHFYSIPHEDVVAIDCSDLSKPAATPVGYALPDISIPGLGDLIGLCVPIMGMHALPEADLVLEEPFRATMVLGYYGGKPIFIEPMITVAQLAEETSFSLDVPHVAGLPEGVRYPTQFRADYDAVSRSYRFVFSGFETTAAEAK